MLFRDIADASGISRIMLRAIRYFRYSIKKYFIQDKIFFLTHFIQLLWILLQKIKYTFLENSVKSFWLRISCAGSN